MGENFGCAASPEAAFFDLKCKSCFRKSRIANGKNESPALRKGEQIGKIKGPNSGEAGHHKRRKKRLNFSNSASFFT
ncbi:hypothetical protein DDT91_03675 [Algoriphagus sp. AK58]|nr:hypothetical protein [Algoriphagus sp. AK58]